MKSDLLSRVIPDTSEKAIYLRLGAAALTPAAIETRAQTLQTRRTVMGRTSWCLFFIGLVGLTLSVVALVPTLLWSNYFSQITGMPSKTEIGYAALASLALFFSAIPVDIIINYTNVELRQLKPIAGTDYCLKTLEALDSGGDIATEWRNRAISQRGQLYVYDYHIMSEFADICVAEQRALISRSSLADRSARIDAACRQVHGVA
jgi:hypothetical protein